MRQEIFPCFLPIYSPQGQMLYMNAWCFSWETKDVPGREFFTFLASPCHAANSPKSFQCHHYFVTIFTFLKRKSCIVLKYTRLWVKQYICKINVTLQLPQHYWNTLYCLITTKLHKILNSFLEFFIEYIFIYYILYIYQEILLEKIWEVCYDKSWRNITFKFQKIPP